MIYCVLYAAKSTEDRHGSIPGQIQDCRDAIERAAGYGTFRAALAAAGLAQR